MQLKILSLLIPIVLILLLSACGGQDLANSQKTATLTTDVESITLSYGNSTTFEVNAETVKGKIDNFTIISSDTDVFDVNTTLSDSNITNKVVTVFAKSIGTSTMIITSTSGIVLELEVIVTDGPTLTLDKSAISLDINTTQTITPTALIDGTNIDSISASSSDTNIMTVAVTDNVIVVSAINPGFAIVTVTSGSNISVTCDVVVNFNEDVNNYANNESYNAYTIVSQDVIKDVVANNKDWFVIDTAVGTTYEVQLTKFVNNGAVEAKISPYESMSEYTLVSTDITNLQNTVVNKFTANTTKYYIEVSNYKDVNDTENIYNVDSIEYELGINALPDPIVYPTSLTLQEYTIGIVNDDKGTIYQFAGEYGKLYEVWVSDVGSQSVTDYTLDVEVSAYTENKKDIYFSKSNKVYNQYETINPIKNETINIYVQPRTLGDTGTFAIKIVEKQSASDGSTLVQFPLVDNLIYNSKIGKNELMDNISYYSTDAISGVTKTISIDNISPYEALVLNIYEDSTCTQAVASVDSNYESSVSLNHMYTKTGIFCVTVTNIGNDYNTTYEMKVFGNKPDSSNTYSSTLEYDIPDNDTSGVLSKIEVKYGIASISKVTVNLNITHSYDGDLNISIISPTGEVSSLSNRRGSSSEDFINTNFDDNASISISDENATAPFSGSFIPETPLSVFNTLVSDGNWTLKVVDSMNGDTGTIDSWSLTIE